MDQAHARHGALELPESPRERERTARSDRATGRSQGRARS